MRKHIYLVVLIIVIMAFSAGGCGGLHVNVGAESKKEALKEHVLEGRGAGKVLVIPIRGFLSDAPKTGFLSDHPSVVEEVASQLRLAEKDDAIRAVVLEIDSAGGSTTASDMLYHEITGFKERTGVRVVAVLMDVAASGGYYVALAADHIVAHPTTITGSIGVIFIAPKVSGLMEKLGLALEVSKSGKEKDMASPFRPSTEEEKRILQGVTDGLGRKFLDLTAARRTIGPKAMADISGARIYLAEEALELKLIDRIGYMDDALSEAKDLAGLPKGAKVVAYRRGKYPDDNIYNTAMSNSGSGTSPLAGLTLPDILPALHPGFYYLWTPGAAFK
jgi:protease-4